MKSHKEMYVASSVAGVKVNKATTRKLNKRNEGVEMAIPGVKRKRYTPDSPELKIRTSYRGTVTPVKTKFGKIREKLHTHCRVNKLSLEKSQTRSSEDKMLHGVQTNVHETGTFTGVRSWISYGNTKLISGVW
jgi:hypothetical protein